MQEEYDIFDDLGNTDFDNVDTSYPVLAPGLVELEVVSVERQAWKSGQGSSLVITSKTVQDLEDVTGERVVTAGYKVIDRISLVQKGNYDPIKKVASFLEAVGMKSEPFDKTGEAYVGLQYMAKLKVEPATDEYPAKNEVAAYIKAS